MHWPHLSPLLLLIVAVAVTVGAAAWEWASRRGRERQLLELARAWGMHYTPRDTFNLAARIAPHLPVPGAADVLVRDLIYGTEPAGHRYVFLAEYTTGVVRAKKREACIVSVLEPRDHSDPSMWTSMRTVPAAGDLVEQYATARA